MSDEDEPIDPHSMSERDWEVYKLKEMGNWEDARLEAQRNHEAALEDFRYKAVFSHGEVQAHYSEWDKIRDLGQQLYALVVTSVVLASGGGMTAIISIFSDALGEGAAGLPAPFDTVFQLFAAALILILVSAAAGRLANDFVLFSMGLDTTKFPMQRTLDDEKVKGRKIFNAIGYGTAILSLISLSVAIGIAVASV